MPGPSPTWDTVLVYGTWRNPATGQPITGKVRFTFPVRVQAVTDDIIFPAGTSIEATLSNLGSVGAYLPAVDDPDIVSETGEPWDIQVTELLDTGASQTYNIRPLIAHTGTGFNLRTRSTGNADVLSPTVPANVTASNVTATPFTLSWSASTDAVGVTGYEVQIGGVAYATPTGTTLAVTGRTGSTAYSVRVRARDAAGNWSALSTAITVNTASAASSTTQTLFTSQTPTSPNNNDTNQALTVGTQFVAEEDGYVTGVRFYAPTTLPTSPIGLLYNDETGSELARATYGTITAGWNTVTFATPVAVIPGVTYLAAYWSSSNYVSSSGVFPFTNGLLAGLGGRYGYGTTPAFPSSPSAGSYFADPVFALPATLTPVAWEGGPAYYSSFTNAVARGMTSDSFFPLLVDFESVETQAQVDADKAYGVNGYYRLTNNSDMALVRTNGMIAFPGPAKSGVGQETVGWNVDDEVDMWAGPGWSTWNGLYVGQGAGPNASCGYDVMAQLTSATGPQGPMVADGRMKHMNYGKGVVFWEDDDQAMVFTNGGSSDGKSFSLNAVSADLYFYSDTNTITEATTFKSIPTGEVRRAANYGRHVVARVRNLQRRAGIFQPTYGFVEVTSQGTNVTQAELTDDKIEGAVWSCLLYEARGIIYFVHDFIYSGNAHNLRDDIGGHTARVTSLNARITALAPVLNTQSIHAHYNSSVKTMTKQHGGYTYIFAMSRRQATHDTTARTFTLPTGITGTTLTVLNESRTLPITSGTFTDSFAAEYTCHIYRIS